MEIGIFERMIERLQQRAADQQTEMEGALDDLLSDIEGIADESDDAEVEMSGEVELEESSGEVGLFGNRKKGKGRGKGQGRMKGSSRNKDRAKGKARQTRRQLTESSRELQGDIDKLKGQIKALDKGKANKETASDRPSILGAMDSISLATGASDTASAVSSHNLEINWITLINGSGVSATVRELKLQNDVIFDGDNTMEIPPGVSQIELPRPYMLSKTHSVSALFTNNDTATFRMTIMATELRPVFGRV